MDKVNRIDLITSIYYNSDLTLSTIGTNNKYVHAAWKPNQLEWIYSHQRGFNHNRYIYTYLSFIISSLILNYILCLFACKSVSNHFMSINPSVEAHVIISSLPLCLYVWFYEIWFHWCSLNLLLFFFSLKVWDRSLSISDFPERSQPFLFQLARQTLTFWDQIRHNDEELIRVSYSL